jgi:large subunit ribosomal protein L32e
MVDKKLLELRQKAKRKKPHFTVRASAFSARVKDRWRFPRGRHSAIRQEHTGKPPLVTVGYGSPRAVRGLHHSGLLPVRVATSKQMESLDPTTEGAVLPGTMGGRKRLTLLELAQQKKIRVFNVKDLTAALAKIKEDFAGRKKKKAEKTKTKSSKEEEKKKKAEEKLKKETEKESKSEKNPEGDIETKLNQAKDEQDEQKKIAEKTITKKQ